jgi:mannitol-1-phosphate/altronate dehydrogenase
MEREDVNELILQKVDDIEDDGIRKFVEDILRFERAELDKKRPHYKDDYKTYLEDHIEQWENPESGD